MSFAKEKSLWLEGERGRPQQGDPQQTLTDAEGEGENMRGKELGRGQKGS